jgi:hypothetical protein
MRVPNLVKEAWHWLWILAMAFGALYLVMDAIFWVIQRRGTLP